MHKRPRISSGSGSTASHNTERVGSSLGAQAQRESQQHMKLTPRADRARQRTTIRASFSFVCGDLVNRLRNCGACPRVSRDKAIIHDAESIAWLDLALSRRIHVDDATISPPPAR